MACKVLANMNIVLLCKFLYLFSYFVELDSRPANVNGIIKCLLGQCYDISDLRGRCMIRAAIYQSGVRVAMETIEICRNIQIYFVSQINGSD